MLSRNGEITKRWVYRERIMSLIQKGIVSGSMFILLSSLCSKNAIFFEDQEVENRHSISAVFKLTEKIWEICVKTFIVTAHQDFHNIYWFSDKSVVSGAIVTNRKLVGKCHNQQMFRFLTVYIEQWKVIRETYWRLAFRDVSIFPTLILILQLITKFAHT